MKPKIPKLSMMAASAENHVIGDGLEIPWQANGEQLLFQAMTYNKWLLVGRKTFEAMGVLPNRKYAVISRASVQPDTERVLWFPSIGAALEELGHITEHVFVSGGRQIYQALMPQVSCIHLSVVHTQARGDILFPQIPNDFTKVFEQHFESNIDYTYQIWQRGPLAK